MLLKKCEICEKMFDPKRYKWSRFCSVKCGKEFARRKSKERVWTNTLHLSPAGIGAYGELVVCADLLKRGFHVFRSISPDSPCDLVVMTRAGRVLRIEVKSGYIVPEGAKPMYGKARANQPFDNLAVVVNTVVTYVPELPPAHDSEIAATNAQHLLQEV